MHYFNCDTNMGIHERTRLLNDLITLISLAGGGKIIFAEGMYELGTIELKSHITLYLEKGATLLSSTKIEDFPKIGYKHNEMGEVTSSIFAMGCENISIEGEGCIDLNGHHWFDSNQPDIPENLRDVMTQEQVKECTWRYKERVNQPIFFYRCEQIVIKGITIKNAPCWTITLAESRNVFIGQIVIKNHPNIPNNDGVHICASSQVTITGCFMACADDCVAVSSIIDWEIPSEDIIISDCQFKSHSKAIVLGYMQSIVRNVLIQNVIIKESNRGICLMSSYGDGLVERVRVNNCMIDTRIRAGNWWGNGEPIFLMGTYHHGYEQEVIRTWPTNIHDIIFSNITCMGENAIGIIGEKNNIIDVTFKDIRYVKKASDNLSLKGNVFCVAPSKQVETIPQDDHVYGMVIRNAIDIIIENVKMTSLDGSQCQLYKA